MGKYNIHAGHCPQGKGASGAVGLLQESVENRNVKNELISLLKSEGNTVYDCTCDVATTQSGCLAKIVAKCNQHAVDADVSIHLNSGRKDKQGDGSTGGVEVYVYSTDSEVYDMAKRICEEISKELGIRNRGVKVSTMLYVLKNTKSPALLIECCFVDDKDDYDSWDANKCAAAIYSGITGKKTAAVSSVSSKPETSKPTTSTKSYKVKINTPSGVNVRSGAGEKYGILTAIPNGTTVTISKVYDGWGYTSYGGKKGWISLKYTKKVTSSSNSSSSNKFNKSDWVRRLQTECNEQGFSNQKVDGKEGPDTLAGCPLVKEGASGGITKLIQEYLISHGYSCGSAGADGKFGSDTSAAVMDWQKDHNLTVDGDVGQKTWSSFLGL